MLLLGKDPQFVCTLIASTMPTKLASILVIFLQIFVTYDALVLIHWVEIDRSLKSEDGVLELEADFLVGADMYLICVQNQVFLNLCPVVHLLAQE